MKFCLFFAFSLIQLTSFCQSSRIADFSISRTNDFGVFVSWTMNAGSTCLTTKVEHSLDGEHFTPVYTYPGICGDAVEEVTYDWTDNNARKYALNFYRMKLEESEYTLVESVDLDSHLAEDELKIIQNNGSEITFQLRNEGSQRFDLIIYNSSGIEVLRKNDVQGNEIKINAVSFSTSYYIVSAQFSNGVRYNSGFVYLRN